MRPAMPNVNSPQNAVPICDVNSHVTYPGQGAIPSVLVNKYSGDVMEFPEFRRKFKKFVEAVYLDDDVRLSFLQALCVGRAANLRVLVVIWTEHWHTKLLGNV